MRITVGAVVRRGRAIDLRDLDLDPGAVLAGIRGTNGPLTVEAPEPTPVHDRIGHVRPGMGVRIQTALAVAARSRGFEPPQVDAIAEVEDRLESMDTPALSVQQHSQTVDDGDVDAVRERVAELRGRLQALQDLDADTTAVETELQDAIRRLAELETEQVAARETRAERRSSARAVRDRREKRLELEDRLANLERSARAWLVSEVEDEYCEAVAAVPGRTPADPFEADGVTAALALGRVASLAAPILVRCDRFVEPSAAATWLEAPVIRL